MKLFEMLRVDYVKIGYQWLLLLWPVIAITNSAFAQTPTPTPYEKTSQLPAPNASQAIAGKKRWIEIDAFALSTRYRFVESDSHLTTANQIQYQVIARGRFNFDRDGKYSVYAGLFTGNSLTSGWNNSGWGTGRGQTNLYLKQLFLDIKPVKWLEIQGGGIAGYNGENTEITGLDNDVYLTGERVFIRRPEKLFFDEISATSAFIGDTATPNVFRRFKRLDESNYHQVMIRKQVNKRIGFSADYTFESGHDTLHQAVNIKLPELHFIDRLLFEDYQRIDPEPGYGFALSAEKKIGRRLTFNGGFARIDRPMLNADRFPPGKRVFVNSSVKISREFSVNTALTQAVGELPSGASPRTRLDVILTYNFLETLRRTKIF